MSPKQREAALELLGLSAVPVDEFIRECQLSRRLLSLFFWRPNSRVRWNGTLETGFHVEFVKYFKDVKAEGLRNGSDDHRRSALGLV